MANDEQLLVLKKGIVTWNEWRSANMSIRIDLSDANLRNERLGGANLRNANLRDACLNRAILRRASLRGADLSNATFYRADLSKADLSGANLSNTNLGLVNLSDADLQGANLSGASLRDADLSHADLSNADLSNANLSIANLRRATLRSANLSNANLGRAHLNRVDLSNANLSDVDLTGAILCRTKVRAATFTGTNFGGTTFAFLNLKDALHIDTCKHLYGSAIDFMTLEQSGPLPISFLRGFGLPELMIDYLPSIMNRAIEFYSCFISYSHTDEAFARRLHDQLQGRGIRCWLDLHQMRPGDDIYEQVQRGIKHWDKVLLCCSQSSLTSWWVDNEIDTAFAKERILMKQRDKKVLALIPLNLDNYLFSGKWESGKAEAVKSRLAADFTGWNNNNATFDVAFEHVVKALRSDDNAIELPPQAKL